MIVNTKLLDPGTTGGVRLVAPSPGGYELLCTFPDHNTPAFGYCIVSGLAMEITP